MGYGNKHSLVICGQRSETNGLKMFMLLLFDVVFAAAVVSVGEQSEDLAAFDFSSSSCSLWSVA